MNAIRFTSKSKKLELTQMPIPKILEPATVLIKVAYAGVCGTDLHIIKGEFPCNEIKPFTLGHELSGLVLDVAPDVTTIKKGDRVSVDPNNGCNCCTFCRSGKPHFCNEGGIHNTIGIFRDGGWAEYVLVPLAQVHKLPVGITLEQAVLCEPMSCLAHGWDLIQPVHVGQNILITGAGIIGSLWVCALHHQGHRSVTVSEPNPTRLGIIQKLGTGFSLTTPDQLREKSVNPKQGLLYDLIIECSGFPLAIEHAITLLNRGGKLCIFGVAPPNEKISVAPFDIYMRELSIIGVNINPFAFPKSIGLIKAMGDKYINYEKLGIKTFDLKRYEEAFENLKNGTIAKAVFKL